MEHSSSRTAPTLGAVIAQVLVLDMVFSIDSVITAVGMTTYVPVMVIAIAAAVGWHFSEVHESAEVGILTPVRISPRNEQDGLDATSF